MTILAEQVKEYKDSEKPLRFSYKNWFAKNKMLRQRFACTDDQIRERARLLFRHVSKEILQIENDIQEPLHNCGDEQYYDNYYYKDHNHVNANKALDIAPVSSIRHVNIPQTSRNAMGHSNRTKR